MVTDCKTHREIFFCGTKNIDRKVTSDRNQWVAWFQAVFLLCLPSYIFASYNLPQHTVSEWRHQQ